MNKIYSDEIKKAKSPRIDAYLKKYYGNTLDIKKQNRDYVKKFEEKNNNINSKRKVKRKKKIFSIADRTFHNLKDRLRSEFQKNGKFGIEIEKKIQKKTFKNKTLKKKIVNKSQNIKSKKISFNLRDNLKISKKKKLKIPKIKENLLKKKNEEDLTFSFTKDIEKEIQKYKIDKEKNIKLTINQKKEQKNEKEYLKIGETIKNIDLTELQNAQYFSFDKKFPPNINLDTTKEKKNNKKENYNNNNFFIILQNNNKSHTSDSYKQIFKNSLSIKSINSPKRNTYQKLLLNPSDISSSRNPSIDLKITDSLKLESNLLKTEKKFTNESSSLGLSETIGKIKYQDDCLKKKYKENKILKEEDLIKRKITYDSLIVNSKQLFRVPEKINSERNVNIFNFLNSTHKKKQKFFSTYDQINSEKQVGKEFKKFYNVNKSKNSKNLTKKQSKDYLVLIFKNNYKLLNSNTPHQMINSEDENEEEKIMQKFTKENESEYTSSNEKKNSKESVNKFNIINTKIIEESESQSEVENNNETFLEKKEFSKKLDLIIFWMIDRKVKIIQRAWENFKKKKKKKIFFKIKNFWKEFLRKIKIKKKKKYNNVKNINILSNREIKTDFFNFLENKKKYSTDKIFFQNISENFDNYLYQIFADF